MDKNEYNLKLEEIDKYVSQENYSEAAKVADGIDWRRVRNVRTLCMISEIYEADNRYEDSKALLLRAYRRSPMGRSILYRLVEVTIQLKQFDEAIEYYSEYVQAAPHDTSRYILKYKIYRGRGSSVDEQIDILKEYLDQEYSEKWAYELAKLYQQADRIPECLTTCDDLVLWFHSGKYVTKALELKRKYAQLTPKQQEIYDHRFDEEEETDEAKLGQEKQIVETSEDTEAEEILADVQKEIADSLSDEDGIREDTAEEIGEEPQALTEEPAAKEEGETPGEAAEAYRQPAEEPARDLHAEMVKNMREIVAGVGRRGEEPEEDELAADEIIEQSKAEQLSSEKADRQRTPLQRTPRVELPKQQPAGEAGKLSIDDILLSMGERGNEMREIAAKAAADPETKSPAAGVVSAVDEALLNMGLKNPSASAEEEDDILEEDAREELKEELEILAEEVPGTEPEFLREEESETEPEFLREEAPGTEPELLREEAPGTEPEFLREEAPGTEPEVLREDGAESPVEIDLTEEEIISAKTRRIPSDEIEEIKAAREVDWLTEEEPEYPGEEPEASEDGSDAEENPSDENAAQTTDDRQNAAYSNGPRLKDQQKDMFAGFIGIQNMEQQIAAAIAQAGQKGNDRTSRSGNILIFGGHGCGKTTIATNIAKAIAQDRGNQFVKMAKIYAADFNRKDIASTIAKIAGGILIIEEAGDLEDGVVDQLTTAMEFRTDGLIVILEDEQKYIHELLMRHPRFTMKFTAQIYIPVFTNDELVRFGQIYAEDLDYVFSESATTALYNRISGVSTQGDAVSITNVKELVDRAITRSNKFFRKLTAGKKRYDENNCIILQEKDFK